LLEGISQFQFLVAAYAKTSQRLEVGTPSNNEHSTVEDIDCLCSSPQTQLQWKRCIDLPVGMSSAQAVVMGEKVYVGGGGTENKDDAHYIFQYNTSGDELSRLPPHPRSLICFAMAQFTGHLITVGVG